MSQSAQEDSRHLLSPPTRRETPSKCVPTRAGGLPTPLHSSCADPTLSLSGSSSKRARPVPGVQGAPLRPQEDPRHLLSPPTRRETPSKRVSALTGGMSAPLHSSCSDPISQWILLQACSTRSGGAGSPPKTSGGPRTTLQSSYAQGNPLQACFGSHRRNVGALALLLFRPYLSVDPPQSVLDPFRGCREPS